MKLVIAGLVQDVKYFEEKIKPYLNHKDVIYWGNADPEQRNELLGGAYALLHPVNFEEPFGLIIVESYFCGTPVVAFKRGSMPELVIEGKTGFLVNNNYEAVEALKNIKNLNRKDCRDLANSKFTRSIMAENYLKVYKQILKGK